MIAAEDGRQALDVARRHEGRLDLLLSDVQMPHMTGPDLARALKHDRPDLHVMLISAYPQGLLVLDSGWIFLQKPFRPDAILQKVREILSKPPRAETHQG